MNADASGGHLGAAECSVHLHLHLMALDKLLPTALPEQARGGVAPLAHVCSIQEVLLVESKSIKREGHLFSVATVQVPTVFGDSEHIIDLTNNCNQSTL